MKKKIWLGVGLLVLLVLIILGVVWGPKALSFYWYEYLNRKNLAEFEAIENAYKTDTNGGVTPKETLDLFVEALKAEDAELAASYFVPEKRGEMEEELKAGLKSGGVELLLRDISKINNENLVGEGKRFEFSVIQDGQVTFSYLLVKNEFSQKWLIESL